MISMIVDAQHMTWMTLSAVRQTRCDRSLDRSKSNAICSPVPDHTLVVATPPQCARVPHRWCSDGARGPGPSIVITDLGTAASFPARGRFGCSSLYLHCTVTRYSRIVLLALSLTDSPDAAFLSGDERSEQFVSKASKYFETLTVYFHFPVFSLLCVAGHLIGDPLIARTYLRSARIPLDPHRPSDGCVLLPYEVGLLVPRTADANNGTCVCRGLSDAKTPSLLDEHVKRWQRALCGVAGHARCDARRAEAPVERRRAIMSPDGGGMAFS